MACTQWCFQENDLVDKVGEHDFTVGQCSLLRGHVLQRLALGSRCGFTCFQLMHSTKELAFLFYVIRLLQS